MVLSKTLIVFTLIILIILVLFIGFVAKYQNDKTYETFKETRIKKAEAEKDQAYNTENANNPKSFNDK
ncbi:MULTISPECIES: hypothetical protein [Enterococcus]|uniref:hypothetical protein n=1 Tax=Enterococcus TaxID=1350 RepID=UPI000CF16A44|nr:hypothetical protein [Enterococcus faecium]EGP4915335.1 hypothetical protein [Enterococcus faecium]EGP4917776.1 hypothetical protein [Enterococcus faecium]EGP5344007.1 hypothetical protein [Enterococcus faecium]EGP5672485.1 hypothetical protein [Enterococcus faecium]EGP5699591.1 hypothetical protein [Enterococcus faecium]